jgi:E3 ubiquitin-protein ligase HUWE1
MVFCAAVYKHMLGKAVDHKDLESIDPEYYKSLVWMLSNDIDGVLDLTFSVERDDFGVTKIVDLVPDGRNIAVTNENKAEYIRLVADQRLSTEIKDQIAVRFRSHSSFTIPGNHTESFILVLGSTRWFVRNRS